MASCKLPKCAEKSHPLQGRSHCKTGKVYEDSCAIAKLAPKTSDVCGAAAYSAPMMQPIVRMLPQPQCNQKKV